MVSDMAASLSLMEVTMKAVSFMLGPTNVAASERISDTLAPYGEPVLAFAASRGIRIIPLSLGQHYRDASPTLARIGVNVDAWPVPPAGLFIVEERTVYLRSSSSMTCAHEFGHALDVALGGSVYRSGYDPGIRAAFQGARAYVTPYAASAIDEYFAEACRAWVGINDPDSPWPAATRERLLALDPAMHAIMGDLMEHMAAMA
jgi:hypothetical protein